MANPWLDHLKKFYAANKSKMSYKEAMKEAKKTYKKEPKKKGGAFLSGVSAPKIMGGAIK